MRRQPGATLTRIHSRKRRASGPGKAGVQAEFSLLWLRYLGSSEFQLSVSNELGHSSCGPGEQQGAQKLTPGASATTQGR